MENFNLIEKYLLDKMTTDEKVAFEERLKNDSELRTEKETISDLILGVESLGLKNKLSERKIGGTSSSKVVEMKPKSLFSFQKLAVAASIAAIFFCGWWFMKPDLNSEDQLFAQAFNMDPGLPTPMSESNNYSFYDAMVEYKMENYNEAIELWTTTNSNIGRDTLNYYLGMAFLNQNNFDKAIENLKNVNSESALSQKAQWYLLSILIKEQKYAEAKKMIKSIPSSIHPKYEEINKYLETK